MHLRSDYKKISPLHDMIRLQRQALTIWPQFERRPTQDTKENYVCVVVGKEEFRLVSGIFKQNLYSGVF